MISLSNLKRHILYDDTKVTNKIKNTKKKHVKIYVLLYQCFGIVVYQNGKTVFAHHKDTSKFDRCKKKREKFCKTNM